MERIYLDNCSTSFPKAPRMARAMFDYIEDGTVNPNRTESNYAFNVFDQIYGLREKLASFYGYERPECIAFSKNATESLNWIIKGLVKKEDHAIISSNEHNAVMRPLLQVGPEYSKIDSDKFGYNDYKDLEKLVKPNTKVMIINAAGNVSGAIQNLEIPSKIAKKHGILLFIDASQASPFVDINMEKLGIAGICFTGHKGFLGPQGTGGMILRKDIALSINPLISGGTGSESDKETIPTTLPERLEPGTMNIAGLVGLAKAVDYSIKNLDELKERTMANTKKLVEGLSEIKGLEIVGALDVNNRTNAISVISDKKDIAYISYELLKRENIETRVGLHCSPSSHKTLGTFPTGTLRFSAGPFTKEKEINITLKALKEILNE